MSERDNKAADLLARLAIYFFSLTVVLMMVLSILGAIALADLLV